MGARAEKDNPTSNGAEPFMARRGFPSPAADHTGQEGRRSKEQNRRRRMLRPPENHPLFLEGRSESPVPQRTTRPPTERSPFGLRRIPASEPSCPPAADYAGQEGSRSNRRRRMLRPPGAHPPSSWRGEHASPCRDGTRFSVERSLSSGTPNRLLRLRRTTPVRKEAAPKSAGGVACSALHEPTRPLPGGASLRARPANGMPDSGGAEPFRAPESRRPNRLRPPAADCAAPGTKPLRD